MYSEVLIGPLGAFDQRVLKAFAGRGIPPPVHRSRCTVGGVRSSRALAVALALLALVAAGCSSSSDLRPGRAVFAASCSSCHTLTGHDTSTTGGGDLAILRMSRADILSFARVMPTPHRLSLRELEAVAAYIAAAQRRR